jgi:hypothetical protein
MKTYLSLALITLGLAACQTSFSSQTRTSVDDDVLVQVPVADRGDINKARAESQDAVDRIGIAEHEVDLAKEKLRQAEHTASMANQEVAEARKRSKNSENSASDADKQLATDNCDAACAHARWAEAQVVYHEHAVEDMKARVGLETLRKKLADAKVELAKAEAVNAADHEPVEPFDVAAFESAVAARQLDVAMAEVDRDAWVKKMQLCRAAVEAKAQEVPASFGADWLKTEAVEPAPAVK